MEMGHGTWRFCKVTVTAGLFLYGWMGERWGDFGDKMGYVLRGLFIFFLLGVLFF